MTACIRILPVLLLSAGMALYLPAAAQERDGGESAFSPEARRAVVSGRITDLSYRGMTIRSHGREITVSAGALATAEDDGGALSRYFEEGMFVEVEGVLTGRDEVDAARITRISRYETGVPGATPYIADDPGIIGAEDFPPLLPD